MKARIFLTGIIMMGFLLVNPCQGQKIADSILIKEAIRALRKANVANVATITLGLASNIEMASIGGFPLEFDEGMNAGYNLTHMVLAIGRVFTSIGPPVGVSRTRQILKPLREYRGNSASYKRLFSALDAAQVLTAVAPVLCVSGGIMMAVASTQRSKSWEWDYYASTGEMKTKTNNPGLKTAGWILVGAGLAASISSAVLIGISKNILKEKVGSVKLAAISAGVSLQYNFPSRNR
jgi:hypothetical protein